MAEEREEHLFVVRVWREANASHDDDWRGSVEHVSSGTRRYFTEFDALDRFIATKFGRAAASDERA